LHTLLVGLGFLTISASSYCFGPGAPDDISNFYASCELVLISIIVELLGFQSTYIAVGRSWEAMSLPVLMSLVKSGTILSINW
jgi:hypothetical protein